MFYRGFPPSAGKIGWYGSRKTGRFNRDCARPICHIQIEVHLQLLIPHKMRFDTSATAIFNQIVIYFINLNSTIFNQITKHQCQIILHFLDQPRQILMSMSSVIAITDRQTHTHTKSLFFSGLYALVAPPPRRFFHFTPKNYRRLEIIGCSVFQINN